MGINLTWACLPVQDIATTPDVATNVAMSLFYFLRSFMFILLSLGKYNFCTAITCLSATSGLSIKW